MLTIVAGVTEVIVRELRLRGYDDVHLAVPAVHDPHAVAADGAPPVRETSPTDRLARRYSRRRARDVTVDL